MSQLKKARVVVAHREASVRQIVREALEARGVWVETTESGEDAVRLTREARPEAVLLSLDLENLDGWTVLERLRAEVSTDTLLVALTADARAETRRLALERGFTSYLTLPIRPFALLEHLEELGLNGSD